MLGHGHERGLAHAVVEDAGGGRGDGRRRGGSAGEEVVELYDAGGGGAAGGGDGDVVGGRGREGVRAGRVGMRFPFPPRAPEDILLACAFAAAAALAALVAAALEAAAALAAAAAAAFALANMARLAVLAIFLAESPREGETEEWEEEGGRAWSAVAIVVAARRWVRSACAGGGLRRGGETRSRT